MITYIYFRLYYDQNHSDNPSSASILLPPMPESLIVTLVHDDLNCVDYHYITKCFQICIKPLKTGATLDNIRDAKPSASGYLVT